MTVDADVGVISASESDWFTYIVPETLTYLDNVKDPMDLKR